MICLLNSTANPAQFEDIWVKLAVLFIRKIANDYFFNFLELILENNHYRWKPLICQCILFTYFLNLILGAFPCIPISIFLLKSCFEEKIYWWELWAVQILIIFVWNSLMPHFCRLPYELILFWHSRKNYLNWILG